MAAKPSVPVTDPISASISQLSESAVLLNTVSDELAGAIAPIDAALKQLNLGVAAWHQYEGSRDQDGEYWGHLIGYAKVSGKWGLAISSISGNVNYYREESDETWLFNDAPRLMRIAAVDHIPDLLEKLVAQAKKVAADIQQKVNKTRELADAMGAVQTTARGRK